MTPGAGPLVSTRADSNMLDTYNKAIYPSQPDTTGQVCPPGAKPRVTATLWEDEGSLCFQVEAKGVCVARREGECNDRLSNTLNEKNQRLT